MLAVGWKIVISGQLLLVLTACYMIFLQFPSCPYLLLAVLAPADDLLLPSFVLVKWENFLTTSSILLSSSWYLKYFTACESQTWHMQVRIMVSSFRNCNAVVLDPIFPAPTQKKKIAVWLRETTSHTCASKLNGLCPVLITRLGARDIVRYVSPNFSKQVRSGLFGPVRKLNRHDQLLEPRGFIHNGVQQVFFFKGLTTRTIDSVGCGRDNDGSFTPNYGRIT